jgi:GxxExxY protein
MNRAGLIEPDDAINELSRQVLGAAIEVHRTLGPGFLEGVYEEALSVELGLRKIQFVRQPIVGVRYKGVQVGEGRLDLLVGGRLVVELKAVDRLLPIHRAQVLSYLKAVGSPLGLLLNFKCVLLKDGIDRVVLGELE